MPSERQQRIAGDAEIQVQGGHTDIPAEQFDELREFGVIQGHSINSDGVVRMNIDFQRFAELIYEYGTLTSIASSVQYEILEFYRNADGTTYTTSEISEAIDRPKSSVSRSLNELCEKNILVKVQKGVYRRS